MTLYLTQSSSQEQSLESDINLVRCNCLMYNLEESLIVKRAQRLTRILLSSVTDTTTESDFALEEDVHLIGIGGNSDSDTAAIPSDTREPSNLKIKFKLLPQSIDEATDPRDAESDEFPSDLDAVDRMCS